MFSLVSSDPEARVPLIDFHFKSSFDDYLDAIKDVTGRKMLVFSNSVDDMRATIRRLMLISDSMMFNINTYDSAPHLSVFALPDSLASPVLGVAPIIVPGDNDTIISRLPTASEMAEILIQIMEHPQDFDNPESILGFEWNHQNTGWQRTQFARVSDPLSNKKGEKCHAVIGFTHDYSPDTYDWILGEARQLMLDGYLAFAPFIRSSPEPESLGERLQKAKLSSTKLTTKDDELTLRTGTIHPLALLDVPYLENVPLELLAKALRDEGESLRTFRRIVDRALEDVSKLKELSEIKKEITRLKRELLEDELDRVGRLCQRLSRMKSFAAVSAVVTTAAITAVGAMNVDLPTLILTSSAGVTTTLKELVEIYEQQKEIKNSPMHLFWKLGRLKKS